MCCGAKVSLPMQRTESKPNPTAIKDKQKRGYEPPVEPMAENAPQAPGEILPTDQPVAIAADRAEPASRKAQR
jgi:hypothetical protein